MKVYDEKAFLGLKNIDNSYRLNRTVTLTAITLIPLTAIAFVIILLMNNYKKNEELYVLTNDGILVTKRTSVTENRELEAKKHIVKFYQTFLDLDPDPEAIQATLESCYHLGGESIKALADAYRESGFYDKIISNNIIMRHNIVESDIYINMNVYPYEVEAKGLQILKRQSNEVIKSFYIKCFLYDLKNRTSSNVHAFSIEKLIITSNDPLKHESVSRFN